jgi:hypothetical protein
LRLVALGCTSLRQKLNENSLLMKTILRQHFPQCKPNFKVSVDIVWMAAHAPHKLKTDRCTG